jgi:hypothetical protein
MLQQLLNVYIGCLKPDGSESDSDVCKEYLQRNFSAAFADLHSMIHQDLKSGSSFYKTIQSALNNDLIPYGIGEIVFFKNPTPNTEPPAALTAVKNASLQQSNGGSIIDTFKNSSINNIKHGKH